MSNEPNAAPAPAVTPTIAATVSKKTSLWRYLLLGQSKSDELAVYHHSNLFYWWPVWFFGYVMAGITYFGNMHLAVVPEGTVAIAKREILLDDAGGEKATRDVLVLAQGAALPTTVDADGKEVLMQPRFYVAQQKGWGTVFMIILLIVIIITNITFRGLWSFLVLIVIVLLALLATAARWWDDILANLGQLAVHINLGGYLLLSTVLLIFWLVNFFFLDRQTYMIFTPGQVRLRLEIGEGETVYDTSGMVVQKQRGDLFRHWVLGFGSGDLYIRPVGVSEPLELTNVLRVARVVRGIEQMIKEKVILTSPPAS